MRGKYLGIHEYRARSDLLNFLNILWVLDAKRFSRAMLMKELGVPYSIARAFSKGLSKSAHSCYRKLSDADPKIVRAIAELLEAIELAEKIDKLVNNPLMESGMYRSNK